MIRTMTVLCILSGMIHILNKLLIIKYLVQCCQGDKIHKNSYKYIEYSLQYVHNMLSICIQNINNHECETLC